jgi:hypothetical protein
VGGIAVLAGLYFTWANLQITQETATRNQAIAQEGQITDRFTKAIAQLGDAKLAVRLGGIYALERIAKDSEKDHWPIMEVLTAYIRETAPWPPKPLKDIQPSHDEQFSQEEPSRLAADIQAILTVLGRRTQTYGKGETQPLNLAKTDLRGAYLAGSPLEKAVLTGAQLQGAHLAGAQLRWANVAGAQLQGAILREAQLEKAVLREAQLQEADLTRDQLQGAVFTEAQLEGAYLVEAQLERAINLTVKQLSAVKMLCRAHIDSPLLEQIRQRYPHLLNPLSPAPQ